MNNGNRSFNLNNNNTMNSNLQNISTNISGDFSRGANNNNNNDSNKPYYMNNMYNNLNNNNSLQNTGASIVNRSPYPKSNQFLPKSTPNNIHHNDNNSSGLLMNAVPFNLREGEFTSFDGYNHQNGQPNPSVPRVFY
jgi:hypothetical protein